MRPRAKEIFQNGSVSCAACVTCVDGGSRIQGQGVKSWNYVYVTVLLASLIHLLHFLICACTTSRLWPFGTLVFGMFLSFPISIWQFGQLANSLTLVLLIVWCLMGGIVLLPYRDSYYGTTMKNVWIEIIVVRIFGLNLKLRQLSTLHSVTIT
ncbi:hypothetical protein VNO78_01289 [Psophocarpus tetragonolobus]|uniref:Uncharacterized protein n=1 Tax=Psophocarpus tetragonolobus TaxID=3891 RepID=A0AAN9T1I9_PSOTE